jgi:glycosyltransferase involved in cell wall biosynthesis
MDIAIDASCLLINPNCGLAEVVRNLISELLLIEKENKFFLFYNYFRAQKKISNYDFPGTISKILRIPRRLIKWSWKYDKSFMNIFLPDVEIYHSLHIQLPPSDRLKKILTVHDCRYLAFPELYEPHVVEEYRHLMNTSLKRADMVATVSNNTRQDLLKHFNISEERIKVIYNGFKSYVPEAALNTKKMEDLIKKLNLPSQYLFFIGVLDPRKNLKRLIQAISILNEDKKDIPDLVIAGISFEQWKNSDEAKEADRFGVFKRIHVIGVAERNIVFNIMKGSLALCYPSLYEGFGFPPLEAMSMGVPVLAGRNSSIPEVTGDAACLVDPFSANDIAQGLHKIVHDNSYRQKLIERGLEQIMNFCWSRAAAEYIDLYKKVLN